MTLTLKSNVRSSGNVGNVHGNSGPADFVAMLDFGRDEYYRISGGARIDYALNDVVAVSRASVAPYRLRDGVMRAVGANVPRRHYLADHDTEGLMVLQGRTNFAASASSGSVTIPGASEAVILSYRSGSAALTAAELTLAQTTVSGGRTFKRYTRSTSSAISASLEVSGGAEDVQVELAMGGSFASPFAGYGGSVAMENVSLKSPIKGLLSGGTGTIVTRSIFMSDFDVDNRAFAPIAIQSAAPLGGAVLISSRPKGGGGGTDGVWTYPDTTTWGAGTGRFNVVGNWRASFVTALGISGRGNALKIASYGQVNSASGLGTLFGAPSEILLGGATPYANAPGRLGGIITHCIIYNRLLTDDELLLMANQWL